VINFTVAQLSPFQNVEHVNLSKYWFPNDNLSLMILFIVIEVCRYENVENKQNIGFWKVT